MAREWRSREKAVHAKKVKYLPSPKGNKQPPCFGNARVCRGAYGYTHVHACDYTSFLWQSEEGGLDSEGNETSLKNSEGTCYVNEGRHKESQSIPPGFGEEVLKVRGESEGPGMKDRQLLCIRLGQPGGASH